MVQPLSDYVFQAKDLQNGELNDVLGSRLNFYSDKSFNTSAIMSHLMVSQTGMAVAKLTRLCPQWWRPASDFSVLERSPELRRYLRVASECKRIRFCIDPTPSWSQVYAELFSWKSTKSLGSLKKGGVDTITVVACLSKSPNLIRPDRPTIWAGELCPTTDVYCYDTVLPLSASVEPAHASHRQLCRP